ncbi:asparagine synthase (glutamine-hydrolyzing) [Candidatus Vecturithrix granuli]|uniref:asparagine synthase (glutamine-hydrolyzing) n=1 Tax=Vecturithrix granuli TaxID=1499967 RepID=A0A0S6W9L1_VECG1|nr:asparagine synthase (glutamine-hydrolyzing) [Candidatus Vecturithrix granuli]
MIGGYLFQQQQPELARHLHDVLGETYQRIPCGDIGFLFHDTPYSDFATASFTSDRLTLLTQDLLVLSNANGEYRSLNGQKEVPDLFLRKNTEMFHEIVSDFRMIILAHEQSEITLYLVSHRAGNGRMYYSAADSGILFCSDLRFLLKVVPLAVNDAALYAVLKYGASPEPLTISRNISVVPPAHYLRYDLKKGTAQPRVYYQFEFPCDQRQNTPEEFDTLLQPVKQSLCKSASFLCQYHPAILISGGIDSSLYASYLHEFDQGERLHAINCAFGDDDPEFAYAKMMAEKVNARLHVGKMEQKDALSLLEDTVTLTGQPFSDFSSLPIVFILKFMQEHVKEAQMLIEGNGADDCFGFPALGVRSKMELKHRFPGIAKEAIAMLFQHAKSWKWTSHEGFLARVLALADDHEINVLNYFLVFAPVNFLGLHAHRELDREVHEAMESVFSACGKDYQHLSYEAKTTIRQLLHINSRQWAAKAFSVGESLGIRVIYPYIWRDILDIQGTIPWQAKIRNGVVKWPLKRLLEEFMPQEFIYRQKSGFVPPFVRWLTDRDFNRTVRDILLASDAQIRRLVPPRIMAELLDDALNGKNLRFPVLNFLWAALFTEMWIRRNV